MTRASSYHLLINRGRKAGLTTQELNSALSIFQGQRTTTAKAGQDTPAVPLASLDDQEPTPPPLAADARC